MVGAKVEDVDKSERRREARRRRRATRPRSVEVEHLLVAVGRGPATDGLDLERWGVKTDRGYIVIDGENRAADRRVTRSATARRRRRSSRTSRSGWAWRRPSGSPAATPIPVDFERGTSRARSTACRRSRPSGSPKRRRRNEGYDVKVTKHAFAGNAKAQMMHAARGFSKLVADADGAILGIHMIGPRVTELLAEALLTVGWEATPQRSPRSSIRTRRCPK